MVFCKTLTHTNAMSATTLTEFAMKLLYKIATVIVALLLYGVIALLQMPKARAAEVVVLPAATSAAVYVVASARPATD